mmetsp:Transcript_43926/g.82522  ORF Transcript_43926/g.82522 Transcript_43926/m.82522 type:complete len:576 (-) Transcript_43926:150-1877(-)
MTASLQGWTESRTAPIQRLRWWPLLAMLTVGVAAELQDSGCESVSAADAASQAHSLLQMSRPYKGTRDKVQLHLSADDGEASAPSQATKSSHGVQHTDKTDSTSVQKLSVRSTAKVREGNTDVVQGKETKTVGVVPVTSVHGGSAHRESKHEKIGGVQGLSFFQMSDSISEDSSKVSEDIPKAVGGILPGDATTNADSNWLERAISDVKANEVWWRGFVDAAMIIIVVVSVGWSLFLLTKRCRETKWFIRKPRATPHLNVAMTSLGSSLPPMAEQTTAAAKPSALKGPMLSETGVSFAIPLTHHTEAGTNAALRFHIPRRPDGPPVFATVKCAPDHNSWAKIEVTAGGLDGLAPLATCSLVQSASDDESRNVQGAMLSWLSLLLHEKNGAEEAITKDKEPDTSGAPCSSFPSRVRVNLHGMAEDLVHAGVGSAGSQGLRLEVKDGMGASVGTLEPGTMPDEYSLMKQGKSALDIQAEPNSRSFTFTKKGQVVAFARTLGGKRDPEEPELSGEEDEHLQVDIKTGSKWPEIALLLTCVLAMIVFKPEASMLQDEAPEEVSTEGTDSTSQIEDAGCH